MGKKGGGGGENSKKAAGNAKKEAAAAAKAAAADAANAAAEDAEWSKGAKGANKRDLEKAKQQEAARKKAEREAMLAEEEEATGPGGKGKNKKTAVKKSRGLDLAQLDESSPVSSTTSPFSPRSFGDSLSPTLSLNASGIDNALDALALTGNEKAQIERHPERRFKAAYTVYEERRLEEMKEDGTGDGLRKNQRQALIRKEFEKHPDNPFNQVTVAHNATREEIAEIQANERDKTEQRLGGDDGN